MKLFCQKYKNLLIHNDELISEEEQIQIDIQEEKELDKYY